MLFTPAIESVNGTQYFKMFASRQSDNSHSYVDITKNHKESVQSLSF